MSGDPEYGPKGYLPERAATRARKIVLRGPMGIGWVLGSLAAGLVLVVAGLFLLGRGQDPIGPPFVPAGTLDQAPEVGAVEVFADSGDRLLLVRAGQAVRVFRHPGTDVVYCGRSRRLESTGGQVWNLNGRLISAQGRSLQPLRHTVSGVDLYVDLLDEPQRSTPQPDPETTPECV